MMLLKKKSVGKMRFYWWTLLFVLSSKMVFSLDVLPVPSGLWFVGHYTSYDDSCSNPIYEYDHTGTSPNALAQMMLGAPLERDDCVWGAIEQSGTSVEKPINFPGSFDEWKAISNQPLANPLLYKRSCLGDNHLLVKSMSVVVNPIYVCPSGSEETGGRCSATPDLCEADVVGRNLKSTAFGFLGHVGLTDPPSSVLEMLNKASSDLSMSSFQSFLNDSEGDFWGAAYSPLVHQKMTWDDANRVYQKGIEQFMFSPQYTYLPLASPGKILKAYLYDQKTEKFIQEDIFIPAIFRCDSFVNYAYQEGLKEPIINLWMPLMPRTVYKAFTKTREAFPSSELSLSHYVSPPEEDCQDVGCFIKEIDKVLKVQDADPNSLHGLIQAYIRAVNNSETSNNYLYSKALEYQSDPIRYQELLQEIQEPLSLNIISNLVDSYQHYSVKPINCCKFS